MNRKTVCITGAAKGIGAATALLFAENGYNLILHYNTNYLLAQTLKEELEKKYGINVYLIQADLQKEEDINKLISNIKSITNKLDVLINNASLSLDSDILAKSKTEFLNVLEVNLIAPFLIIRGLSDLLNNGTIINISSTDAIDTGSSYNIDYSTSKAGLICLTKILSDYYKDIKIFSLAPNWVKTESVLEMDQDFLKDELIRIGQKELILPDEVAKKIFYMVNNKELPSGSIIRMDDNNE